jgi:hypothetical protein
VKSFALELVTQLGIAFKRADPVLGPAFGLPSCRDSEGRWGVPGLQSSLARPRLLRTRARRRAQHGCLLRRRRFRHDDLPSVEGAREKQHTALRVEARARNGTAALCVPDALVAGEPFVLGGFLAGKETRVELRIHG